MRAMTRKTLFRQDLVTDKLVRKRYEMSKGPLFEASKAREAVRGFRSLAGDLHRLANPTLILWGDADRWIPLRVGTRFARELPRSEFVVVAHTGHDAADESPEQVNRQLLGFLKEGLSRIPENVAVAAPDEGP